MQRGFRVWIQLRTPGRVDYGRGRRPASGSVVHQAFAAGELVGRRSIGIHGSRCEGARSGGGERRREDEHFNHFRHLYFLLFT
jgi:hypothetical protein